MGDVGVGWKRREVLMMVIDLIYESVEVIAERFRKCEKMEKMLAQTGAGTGLEVETKKST